MLLALLLWATEPPPRLTLDWQAPASCPTAADVHQRVVARSRPVSTSIVARVRIAPAEGAFEMQMSLRSARGLATRTLRTATCDTLADAAVMLIALAVEDSAPDANTRTDSPASAAQDRAARRKPSASAAQPEAAHETSSASAAQPEAAHETPSAHPENDARPRTSPPTTSDGRPAGASSDAATRTVTRATAPLAAPQLDSVEALPRPARAVPSERVPSEREVPPVMSPLGPASPSSGRTRVEDRGRGRLGGSLSASPGGARVGDRGRGWWGGSVTAGPGGLAVPAATGWLTAEFGGGRGRFEGHFGPQYWVGRSTPLAGSSAQGRFDLLAGSLRACMRWGWKGFEFPACVGMGVGAMWAQVGGEVVRARSAVAPWVSVSLGVGLRYWWSAHWGLVLRVEGNGVVARPQFAVGGLGVVCCGWGGISGGIGLATRWSTGSRSRRTMAPGTTPLALR